MAESVAAASQGKITGPWADHQAGGQRSATVVRAAQPAGWFVRLSPQVP
jgi:hypothetical protein